MSDGESRAGGWSPEGEEQPGLSDRGHLVVHRWPLRAPQGRHPKQEVHPEDRSVYPAVARPDAGGGGGSAGGAGEADAVLSPPLLREQWGCRGPAYTQTLSGETVPNAAQVQLPDASLTSGSEVICPEVYWVWDSCSVLKCIFF